MLKRQWYVFLSMIIFFSGLNASVQADPFIQLKNQMTQDFLKTDMSVKSAAKILQKIGYQNLPEEKQTILLDDLTDRTRSVLQTRKAYLKNLFESKIYKLTEHALKKELGLKYKNIIDTTTYYNPTKKQIEIYRLSIDNPTSTKRAAIFNDGFYTELVSTIKESDIEKKNIQNFEFEAEIGGQKIKSILETEKRSLRLPPLKATPNYDQMLSDKIYKGVVLIGTNMGTDGLPLAGLYLAYLRDYGFGIDRKPLVVETTDYLKEVFWGSEPMDYFTKEAHSGGDEKNFLRLGKKSLIYKAEKMHIEGYKETVHVVLPVSYELNDTFLLTHDHVAEFMYLREKNKLGELVYLNGSCWSVAKARGEISDINSPLLINLASKSVAMTFRQNRQNGNFILLSSIRYMHGYKMIRDQMNTVNSYVNKTADYFIMPDEAEYQTDIYSQIPKNFKTKISTWVLNQNQWVEIPNID